MIGYRAHAPREVVVSRSKLESLAWDNPDAVIEMTKTAAYLVLDEIAYVAALDSPRGLA